jgi:uncharacterized protein YndB with AHSA1/START domain
VGERAQEWTLRLETTLPAPPQRVFAAFLDPVSLAEWFGPAGFKASSVQIDAREGGRYRITMQPPDDDVFHISGDIREIEAPNRLVYSFAYEEPGPDDRETIVTLTFEPVGEDVRLVLDQRPFETEARLELHRAGLTETLERLARALG